MEALYLADGLSRVADKFKWSKPTEIEAVGKMAELATATGYYALDDLFGPAAAERDHLYNLSFVCAGSWARIPWQILDSRQLAAVPTENARRCPGS